MKTNVGVTAGGLFPCTALSSPATEHFFPPPLLLELIFLVIYVIIEEEMKRK